MSINFDGSTDWYNNTSWTAITGPPYTVAGWANANDLAVPSYLWGMFTSTVDYFHMFMVFGNIFHRAAAPAIGQAATTDAMTVNTWHHVAGTSSGTTNRVAYLDGVASVPNGNNISPSAPGEIVVGAAEITSFPWDGELAHFAMWDRVLDADEMTALAQGWHPRFFSRGLVFLWNGFNLGEDDVYGLALTENGSPLKSDEHPPVFQPSPVNHHSLVTTALGDGRFVYPMAQAADIGPSVAAGVGYY